MRSPHLLYGMARPHDPYLGQPCSASQPGEPLIDLSNMDSNIDPLLDSASPATSAFATGALGHPQKQQVHRFLNDPEKTAFFSLPLAQSPLDLGQQHFHHQSVLPAAAQAPFHQQRWGSPASSHDHGSSCSSALSPTGDSEAFPEIGPATPPAGVDYTVAQPPHFKYQPVGSQTPPQSFWGSPRPFAANDYIAAPCMPAEYVNLSEINQTSQADFDLYTEPNPANYDLESPQRSLTIQSSSPAGFSDFAINRALTPVEAAATAAYHQPGPLKQESADSETERPSSLKRSRSTHQDGDEDNEDGDDSDFAPTRSARFVKTRSRAAPPPKKKPAPRRPSKSQPKSQRRQSSQLEVDLGSPITSAAAPSQTGSGIMLSQAGHGHLTCRDCPQTTSFKTEGALETHVKKQHKRPFVCVFAFAGCESTFASKNEWKRHVVSQHILLNFWVCTQDDCAKTVNVPPVLITSPSNSGDPAMAPTSPAVPARAVNSSLRGRNSCAIAPASSLTSGSGVAGPQHTFGPRLPNGAIFNRKDLYTQHVRRMHAPDRIRQQRLGGSSSSPTTMAPTSHRRRSSSSSTVTAATAMSAAAALDDSEAAAWEIRLKQMQRGAEMERCQLPSHMLCPAPGCKVAFEGSNAWDERMEHLAKHLEAAARGEEPAVPLAGGPGAEPDRSLIEWASRHDVAIIVPRATGGGVGTMQWVLNNPLKPSEVAVMAITAAAATAAAANVHDNSVVLDEIIVERGDEDADGEYDDY